MQKTIYICLMTFFSISTFAFGPYDEYGGGGYSGDSYGSPVRNTGAMTAGGNFWSTNVSAMVANNGVVTNNFDYYSPRYYVGTGGNTQQTDSNWKTAPSILNYQSQPGDVINMYLLHTTPVLGSPLVYDANGNAQFGFIITKDASIMQPANEYSGYTPQQINNAVMGIGNYDPNPSTRPRFGYNEYSNTNNTNTIKIYEVSPSGPVLISTKVIKTYNDIPRVGTLGFPGGGPPNPEFLAAGPLNGKTQLTLDETVQFIGDYIDRIFTDIDGPGGRAAQIEVAIAKYRSTLPDDQKPYADLMVIAKKTGLIVDNDPIPPIPHVYGTNYTFDEKGDLKASNINGDNSIFIDIEGAQLKPSDIDTKNPAHRMILTKIAIFLAKKMNAPVGSWFATGKHPNAQSLSSTVPAFTSSISPFMSVLNMRGDKYSSSFDNVYSFMVIISHELKHQYNFKHGITENIRDHVHVYISTMEEIPFNKSPSNYKLSATIILANYLYNMDKKGGYYPSNIIEDLYKFNQLAPYNGGYKIIAPVDPNNLSHFLFNKGALNSTNLFVYDPITDQNIPIGDHLKIYPNEN